MDAGLEAKTFFEELQRTYPGRFSDGQLRTLQRRVKRWRALEGPSRVNKLIIWFISSTLSRIVYFPQLAAVYVYMIDILI